MQHLNELLNVDNSDLARLLRFNLYGLQASLAAALKEAPNDPGAIATQKLLDELDLLLPASRSSSNSVSSRQDESHWSKIFEPATPSEPPPVAPIPELKLSHLRDILIADPELRYYLGEFQLESQSDKDLWHEIQRKLLRLPASLAEHWRKNTLKLAEEVGAVADPSEKSLQVIPFSRNDLIYPGLTGTVQASGLCWSSNEAFDERITKDTLEGDIYFLAGVVSTWIEFIELDPSLHHALKSVYRFGFKSLASEPEQLKYINALIDRFQRYQKAAANPDLRIALSTLIDLNEAVNSLVYQPPADRDSWWGKLQQSSLNKLYNVLERLQDEGGQVQIRPLWGTYADICSLSKDDLHFDSGGVEGEVLACLRVYAKINAEVFPGRVIFRSIPS